MSYKKATHILPPDLLKKVQEYVEGEAIYIPKVESHKEEWGARTTTRRELEKRNHEIYEHYLSGQSIDSLAELYFLSVKSIQRIIGQEKRKQDSGT